jgi:hypothetical protein
VFRIREIQYWYWYGSGSLDPYILFTDPDLAPDPDPDPALTVCDFQDANKIQVFSNLFCLLFSVSTFTLVHQPSKIKSSQEATKQQKSIFLKNFLVVDGRIRSRIRINKHGFRSRIIQKHKDPTVPDPEPSKGAISLLKIFRKYKRDWMIFIKW